MTDLTSTVLAELRRRSLGRRLKVGVFGRVGANTVLQILREGHRTVVMSDRFRFLYSLGPKSPAAGRGAFTLVETPFDALPVARGSLDAFVLLKGLPRGESIPSALVRLRGLLAPGGVLIWPHPVSDGQRGRLGKLLVPLRRGICGPVSRDRLCARTMEAGYEEVGQRRPKGTGLAPWIVTTGTVGSCPW